MDVNKYIYIPFKEKGRDEWGCDCWGLVRYIYQKERGIELPSYLEDYQTTSDSESISGKISNEKKLHWQDIKHGKEQVFDVVLLRMLGLPMHVGLVTQKGYMLHTSRESGTCHVKYNNIQWEKRVLGFYRYAGT